MSNVYNLFTGKLITDGSEHIAQTQLMDEIVSKSSNFIEVKPNTFRKRTKKDKVCEFTYQPRKNRYSKANCYLDMDTLEARSYAWWAFVKKIQGKLVFNSYQYSVTTSKHQRQLRILLDHLNIKIDMIVNVRTGLQNINTLKELKALDVKKQA